MRLRGHLARRARKPIRGFTLVEFIVCVALCTVILGVIVELTVYATQCFAALANYQSLDDQSRNALDTVCRDMREATSVMTYQTNLPVRSLTLTNAIQGISYTLSWDSNAQTFSYKNSQVGSEVFLTGCDSWNFGLYQRTPLITSTNILYYPATNNVGQLTNSLCKLVSMSWHCYRTILGQKLNTESVQTAQIVLRNKQ